MSYILDIFSQLLTTNYIDFNLQSNWREKSQIREKEDMYCLVHLW